MVVADGTIIQKQNPDCVKSLKLDEIKFSRTINEGQQAVVRYLLVILKKLARLRKF